MANGANEKTVYDKVGTINVTVLSANGLPIMDFAKQQDTYVAATLRGSTEEVRTDTIVDGGQSPEWGEDYNGELELHFDGKEYGLDSVSLTLDVRNDDFSDDARIGIGSVNITRVIAQPEQGPVDFVVRLREQPNGLENRGEVKIRVSFGPPVRASIRAAQKTVKLLAYRDALVRSLYATYVLVFGYFWAVAERPVAAITDQVVANKKLAIAVLAFMAAVITGVAGIAAAAAIPVSILLIVTLPFWIIPVFLGGLMTSPIWLPIAFLVAITIAGVAFLGFGLGLTSRPVRQKGGVFANKIKHSAVGQKLIYN